MATYDNLPVFKAAYDLLLQLYGYGQHWSRDIKFTLGENLKKDILDILVCIYHANTVQDKIEYIENAREKMVTVKLQIRILHDLKQLSVKQYAQLCEMSESVSKQLAKWAKYYQEKQSQEEEDKKKEEEKKKISS